MLHLANSSAGHILTSMVRLPELGRSSFQHTRHFATTAHLLSSVLCHGQVLLLLAAYYHMRTTSGDANLVTNLHIHMLPYGIFRKVQGQAPFS